MQLCSVSKIIIFRQIQCLPAEPLVVISRPLFPLCEALSTVLLLYPPPPPPPPPPAFRQPAPCLRSLEGNKLMTVYLTSRKKSSCSFGF